MEKGSTAKAKANKTKTTTTMIVTTMAKAEDHGKVKIDKYFAGVDVRDVLQQIRNNGNNEDEMVEDLSV
eukprot:3783763-Amphidinium_carterae.1